MFSCWVLVFGMVWDMNQIYYQMMLGCKQNIQVVLESGSFILRWTVFSVLNY